MSTAGQPVDPTDQTVEMPSAEEDEYLEAQVYQREMDHPEEFHNPLVDSLLGDEDAPIVEVADDEPIIVAEEEMIEAQVYQAQMNAASEEYLKRHPGKA